MVPLLLLGLAGLALLGERTHRIVLRSRTRARPFIERVLSLVRAGELEDALRLCAEHQSPVPDIGLVILRSRVRDERELLSAAETFRLTINARLMRPLAWLKHLSTLAILLGALGAAVNLHDALSRSASALVDEGNALASAVTYALPPFAAGLMTALVLLAGHMYLEHQARATMDYTEEFAIRLIDAVIGRQDVRLGHR
jgi:biopolymer transport protein ExbB/TolQ